MTNFLELYQTNKGLTSEQKRELVASLPNDITFDNAFSKNDVAPSDLISILENHGPFWVTLDADPSNRRRQHAVVVSGISDAAKENAEVAYYDVATGRIETSNFTDFVERVKDGNEDLEECLIRRVNKIGEGTPVILPDTYAIQPGEHVYILVAAFNYYTDKYSFSQYTTKYRKKIPAAVDPEVNIFIVVDFIGNITYYKNGTKVAQKLFTAIGPVNYPAGTHDFYFNQTTGYITRNTIYNLITDIGTNNPGQLKEAGIFSHAYYDGPILVNTYDSSFTQYATYLAADPNYADIDCRKTDAAGLDAAKFKAAFASDGVFKVWGCNANSLLNYFVKKVISSPLYKSDGTTADATELTINDATFGGVKVSAEYSAFITSVNNTTGKIKITMGNVKKALASKYLNTYAAKMAETLDITVQSALPGTYASIGMHVTGESAANDNIFRISHDTKANVNIFEKYLSIDIGELKYGLYTKADVTYCKTI
jgi:hypothetical protein